MHPRDHAFMCPDVIARADVDPNHFSRRDFSDEHQREHEPQLTDEHAPHYTAGRANALMKKTDILPARGASMHRITAFLITALIVATPAFAQRPALTAEDYARAETFLGYNTNPLVLHSGVRPVWLPDDRFWYRIATERGREFFLVDPERGTKTAAF